MMRTPTSLEVLALDIAATADRELITRLKLQIGFILSVRPPANSSRLTCSIGGTWKGLLLNETSVRRPKRWRGLGLPEAAIGIGHRPLAA